MFNHRKDLTKKEKKIMERGAKRCIGLVVFALLFAAFSQMLSGCREEEPKVYRIESSELVWEGAYGERIPVIRDVSYLVVGGDAK